jgi:hypothetical protein
MLGKAVGSKSILRGLKNKSELLSHFSCSFVCFAYTNGNYWGRGGAQASPLLPTSLLGSGTCLFTAKCRYDTPLLYVYLHFAGKG